MSLAMTKQERETFLAEVRIGVVSIPTEGRGPLTVPIWYIYEPGGELKFVTGRESRKAKLLAQADRISFCVYNDSLPYRYVSVEGPIVAIEPADLERDIRRFGHRYLGPEGGDQHAERVKDQGSILVRMRPEQWYTVDFGKLG